jgi:hypothetical protein
MGDTRFSETYTGLPAKAKKQQADTEKAFDKKYNSFADCAKHFSYWLPNQIKQTPKEASKQVISKGKLLGL